MKLILKESAPFTEVAGVFMPDYAKLDPDKTRVIPGIKAIRHQQGLKLVVEFKSSDDARLGVVLTGWHQYSPTALSAETDYKFHFFTHGAAMWMDHDIEEE